MTLARKDFAGGAKPTTITATINATDLAIALAASTGWPSGVNGKFGVVVDKGLSTEEKMLVTSRSGLGLVIASTADRGKDGTSAQSHSSGAPIEHCGFAADLDDANDHIYTTSRDDHTQYLNVATAAGDGLGITGRVLNVNVDGSTLETNADAARVKDLGITTAKLAANAVTAAKIANDTITATQIAPDAITASELADNAVDTNAIAASAVTSAKIADGTIATADIANDAIVAALLGNGAFQAAGTAWRAYTGTTPMNPQNQQIMFQAETVAATTNAGGEFAITFPVAFPTAVITILCTNGDSAQIGAWPSVTSMTTSAFTVRFNTISGSSTVTPAGSVPERVNYLAIGY